MNTVNRLKNPCYFISDPWTDTYSDSSPFSKRISMMLKQSVNDNASGKLSFQSVLTIIEIIFKTFDFKKTFFLIRLVLSTLFKPWKKITCFGLFNSFIASLFYQKKSPNFSSIFFNAGAHIQHHYLHNTKHIENLTKNPIGI